MCYLRSDTAFFAECGRSSVGTTMLCYICNVKSLSLIGTGGRRNSAAQSDPKRLLVPWLRMRADGSSAASIGPATTVALPDAPAERMWRSAGRASSQ